MIKKIFLILVPFIFLQAEEIKSLEKTEQVEKVYVEPKTDCLILEDENSIVCKFELSENKKEQNIETQWVSPKGEIDRTRATLMPIDHTSYYDYRYIKGREAGIWTFKVLFDSKEYSTQFELK